MENIVFNDGTKLCCYSNEKNNEYESEYINNYIKTNISIIKNKEWKNTGTGAMFRGDNQNVDTMISNLSSYIVCVKSATNGIFYAFNVADSHAKSVSGIYLKDFTKSTNTESHIAHSNNIEYNSFDVDKKEEKIIASVQEGVTAKLCIINLKTNDYFSITDGDCRDENPFFSRNEPNVVYYNSCGVGRDGGGNFVDFAPSGLYKMNLKTLKIETVKEDFEKGKVSSLIKPKIDNEGNIYYIKRPYKSNKKTGVGGFFLDVLLFPYRILRGFVNFLQVLSVAFSGKSLTSAGDNPTKGKEIKGKQIIIDSNRIEVDEEYKRNLRKNEKDTGFIPYSWQLIKLDKDGKEIVLKNGICDFDINEKGQIICTNGRKIFLLDGNECKKMIDTDCCLNVSFTNSNQEIIKEVKEEIKTEKTKTSLEKCLDNMDLFD